MSPPLESPGLFAAVRLALLLGCISMPQAVLAHGDLHPRIEALSQSIQASPGNADLFLQRGELYRLHGEPELAVADFKDALRLDSTLDLAELGLGRCWLDFGKPEQAKPLLNSFLRKHPKNAEALLVRARVLAALGERRAAAADYTGALGAESSPAPQIYLERARVQADDGFIDEAIAGLDEGMARVGRVAPLELRVIDLELGRKRYDAALARLDRQLERAPRKEFLLFRRGTILEQAGRPEEARAAYFAAAGALRTLPPERQATKAASDLAQQIQGAIARLSKLAKDPSPLARVNNE